MMPVSLAKTGKAFYMCALALLMLGGSLSSWCGDIVLNVEEPRSGNTMTGVSNIRGWAVSSAGIDRIELYVDGEFKTNIPFGGSRLDVGERYPEYPDSDNSGFSMANNYNLKSAGPHVMTIKAYDNDGAVQEREINYNVTRFDDSFITDPADIDIFEVTDLIVGGERSLTLKGIDVQGRKQDVRLDWQTGKQNFSIASVVPSEDGAPGALDGEYSLSRMTIWNGVSPDLPPGLILDTAAGNTTIDGVSFRFGATGTLSIRGEQSRARIRIRLTADGDTDSFEETYNETIIADEGRALKYRDDYGTWDRLVLQRGTQMIWMEYLYGSPDVGDAVMTMHWQKTVNVSAQGISPLQATEAEVPATATSSLPKLPQAIVESIRKLR